MSPAELDEWARLWRGEEDPREQRVFERLAWRVGVKARLLQFADYGLAGLVVGAALVAIASDATPATLLFGLLLGGAAVWATWKRRTLHASAALGRVNDREALLAVARERCLIELRQSRWGLLLFPLGILLAGATKYSASSGGHVERFPAWLAAAVGRGESPLLAMLLLVIGEIYFLVRGLRLRRELRGIDQLIEQYVSETQLDAAGLALAAR